MAPVPPATPPLIVVVEDDHAFRELLGAFLTDEGYRTILVERAADAGHVIRKEQPALVILDLRLESPDAGERVLDELTSDPATATIPVIVSSGHALEQRGLTRRLRERGCAVLPKPFSLDTLLTTIHVHIGLARVDQSGTAEHDAAV